MFYTPREFGNCQRELIVNVNLENPRLSLVFRVAVVIGRSNTGTHLRTHWRSAAFHLKYAGDYFPLLLCILSASDIVLLLGLHPIYIPSLHTTTHLRRPREIYSYKGTHSRDVWILHTHWEIANRCAKNIATLDCRDQYRPDGAIMRTSATIR